MPRRPRERLAATVTLTADGVPAQVLQESLEPLAERLAARAAAPSMTVEPARLTFDLDVPTNASSPADPAALQDLAAAIADITAALDQVLGTGHRAQVVSFTLATQQAREEQQAAQDALLDLVNVTEIADMRGVVKQSASRTTQHETFPRSVTTPAGRELGWRRKDVEQYFSLAEARGRRPAGAETTASDRTSSPTGAGSAPGTQPNHDYRSRLAEALTRAQAAGQQLPELAAAAAGRPQLLLEAPRLLSALDALGGTASVAEQLGVARRTVERWAAGARKATGPTLPAGSRAPAASS